MESPILQENEIQSVVPEKKKEFLTNFSPRIVFTMGFFSCVVLVVFVGFALLLTLSVKEGYLAKALGTPAVAANGGTPTAPAPTGAAPTQPTQPTVGSFRPVDDSDHIRGNKDAKITIVEYSDTECPFCKRFHPTLKQVMDTYKDQVRWVYRHFPLDSLHSKARKEAEATECAAELGGNDKFWTYLDKIYEVTPANNGLDAAQLPILAEQIGLDKKKFEECLASGRHAAKVAADLSDGMSAGVQGTPYAIAIVGDQKVPIEGAYPFEDVKAIIDSINK